VIVAENWPKKSKRLSEGGTQEFADLIIHEKGEKTSSLILEFN
jgi:hypothetical protein